MLVFGISVHIQECVSETAEEKVWKQVLPVVSGDSPKCVTVQKKKHLFNDSCFTLTGQRRENSKGKEKKVHNLMFFCKSVTLPFYLVTFWPALSFRQI